MMELRQRNNLILDYKRVPKESKEDHWDKVVANNRGSRKVQPVQKANRAEMRKWKQNANALWEIEDILDEKFDDSGNVKVLIKWRNWPDKYNSWEPIENLNDDYDNVLKKLRQDKALNKEKNEPKEPRKSKIKTEPETTTKTRTKKITKKKDAPPKKRTRSTVIRQSRALKKQKDDSWGNIEDILEEKEMNGQTYFLIKWEGWPIGDSTWEPRENLAAIDVEKLKERLQKERNNPTRTSEPIKIRITRDMHIEEPISESSDGNTHVIPEKSFCPPWNMGLGKNLSSVYKLNRDKREEEEIEEILQDDYDDDNDDKVSQYSEWIGPTNRKKRIADIRNHLNKVTFQMKQKMFEQELNTMCRGPTSEDMMDEYKDDRMGTLQDDQPKDFDKSSFKIVKHKMNSDGEFYEFCVSEWNQSKRFKFWISLEEAREKYARELIGFLMDYNARQNMI